MAETKPDVKIILKDKPYMGINGQPVEPSPREVQLGISEPGVVQLQKVVGSILCNIDKGDAARLTNLGLKFYNDDSIILTDSDLKFVKGFIRDSQRPAMLRVQLTDLLESGKPVAKKKVT